MFSLQSLKRRAGLSGVGLVTLLLGLSASLIQAYGHSHMTQGIPMLQDHRVAGGSLVVAGGGRVTDEIRQRFAELAGGPHAHIVVIPASEPTPGDEESWLAPWKSVGCSDVQLCNAHDRTMANTTEFCRRLTQATGVWFSGGYQDFLADRYVDTAVQACLHEVLNRNGVVGGCSAGAAILSRVMIQEGELKPVEAAGLDLIANAVVDQHFLKRNRLWRMQQVLESHPNFVGLGVDENTALVVEASTWKISVIGDSYAMICLPPSPGHSSRIEVLKSGEAALLSELRNNHLSYQPPTADQTGPNPPSILRSI